MERILSDISEILSFNQLLDSSLGFFAAGTNRKKADV